MRRYDHDMHSFSWYTQHVAVGITTLPTTSESATHYKEGLSASKSLFIKHRNLQASRNVPASRMYRVLGVVAPAVGGGGKKSTRPKDDDVIDRCSHTYTVLLLLAFAILVISKNFVGDIIQCWVPAYFTSAYADYTNKICWVSNTYYSPFEEDLPKSGEPRKELVYYQWVPLILIVEAFFFYAPSTLWVVFNTKLGIDISSMISSARDIQELDKAEKAKKFIIHHFARLCSGFKGESSGCCPPGRFKRGGKSCMGCGKKGGSYLVFLYLFTKFVYVVNAVGQFFLLNAFLGTTFHLYGLDVLRGMVMNEEWDPTPRFPRETLCDFRVRQLGNVHRYTVQCVLPINLFNEKIFVIIWFWLVFLMAASSISFLIWFFRILDENRNVRYVKGYLQAMDKMNYPNENDARAALRPFAAKYLKSDGVLIIRMIAINTNDLVASEIVACLWEHFHENPPMWHESRTLEKV